jgi:hypothetical protein
MKSGDYNSDNNNNLNERQLLKKILAPMVLEVIGKNYTDIYIKNIDKKYSEYIDNILNKNRFPSFSYSNPNLFNNNINSKDTINNKSSTFWKDYDFVNNTKIDQNINNKDSKNKNFLNMVEISKNNQTNNEEESESIIIKNKENEYEEGEI